MGYIMFTNPERIFGDSTRTKVIGDMQDLQVETGPSPQEMTDHFSYNMGLFEEELTTQLLSEYDLEIAFIPSRQSYIEFKVRENEDAQYIPGPEYDVIVIQGGHFEFGSPLLYNGKLNEEGLKVFIEQLSYRIGLVSDAMNTINTYQEAGQLTEKILRHVVSDEERGIMHFETECEAEESCQFELNAKDGMLTIMSP